MTELLLAVVEHHPPPLPSGVLGEPSATEVSTGNGSIYAVHVKSEIGANPEELESPEWVAPRALHCDDITRSCIASNVLPFRFGTAYDDSTALFKRIDELSNELRQEFDRLRDLDEYRLKIWVGRAPTESATSGADYLRSRRDALAGRSAHTVAVERALLDNTVDASITILSAEEIAAHVLVSCDGWELLVGALADVVERIEYEGPLPPYHFVEVSDGAS